VCHGAEPLRLRPRARRDGGHLVHGKDHRPAPREFGGAVRIEHPVERPRPLSRPEAEPIDTRQSGRVDVRAGDAPALSSLESPDGRAGPRGSTARDAAPGERTIEQVDMSSETYRRRRLREIAARHAQADQPE
jgi:hypothetical protein